MFVRVTWLGVGVVVGVAGSKWAERKLRRAASRLLPAQVSAEFARRGERLAEELRAALVEGRQAMVAREAGLRREMQGAIGPAAPAPAPGRVIDVGPATPRR
jgi:hypothetical protein